MLHSNRINGLFKKNNYVNLHEEKNENKMVN